MRLGPLMSATALVNRHTQLAVRELAPLLAEEGEL
jgi:hypothetical protein